MGTWIKICGITNAADARIAAALRVNALGFVFHAESPRFCIPAAGRAIIADIPPEVVTLGVWFDESADEVAAVADQVRCQFVQTYNPLAAIELRRAGFDVIPAIPAKSREFLDQGWESLCESWQGMIIIDTSRGGRDSCRSERFGNPLAFLEEAICLLPPSCPMVLGGGLTPDNVQDRLHALRPAGVDIASGVEFCPGRKNPTKLMEFIEEVRLWDAMDGSINTAADLSLRP